MGTKGWGCGTVLGIILLLIIIGSLTDKSNQQYQNKGISTSPSSPQFSPKPRPLKEEALESVKVKDFNWYKGGFGNIMVADITIENKSPYDVKDLTISCTHRSKSGTEIDITKGTIYDIVKRGKTKTFKKVNLGFVHSQSASCNCKITNLELYYGVE